MTSSLKAFFSLIRAGLWADVESTDIQNYRFTEPIDWDEVYQLAADQSVVGIVLAGIDWFKVHDSRFTISQEILLQWIGEVQMIEQQNISMNEYVAKLISSLRKQDVYAILVKGQGVAQCYEKPLWRSSGDIDLLLSDSNYEQAKQCLLPFALKTENEFKAFKHQGMTMEGDFVVELHGSMHSRLSKRVDKGIDAVQRDVFFNGSVRSWENCNTQVFLPSPDNDVIFVFTHILHHFFIDGIGLRQICDWCRLLWTYRNSLDIPLLESRLKNMGLMSEWKAFAAMAVYYLGMPAEAIPLYSGDKKWSRKAERIMAFVMEAGNLGHNQKRMYLDSYVWKKALALWRKFKNFYRHTPVFPRDSLLFFCHFVINGLDAASRKE